MGPSTAGLGDPLNAQLTVAGLSGMEDAMSDNHRGDPVTDRLPPAVRGA